MKSQELFPFVKAFRNHWGVFAGKSISFILFNELWRFLSEIETDILTVSNSEIITFDFTVSKTRIYVK